MLFIYLSALEVYDSNSSKNHPRGSCSLRFFTFLFWLSITENAAPILLSEYTGRESSVRECGIGLSIKTETAAREARRRENRDLLPEDRQPSDISTLVQCW